ncbi:10149_t:CDS:1, partial [Gigaspora rosea]
PKTITLSPETITETHNYTTTETLPAETFNHTITETITTTEKLQNLQMTPTTKMDRTQKSIKKIN